jgi:hypothetical protein
MNRDLEAACREVCPHCRHGIAVRFRKETSEFVHDSVWLENLKRAMNGHVICSADRLRKLQRG